MFENATRNAYTTIPGRPLQQVKHLLLLFSINPYMKAKKTCKHHKTQD
jgi:hypothetical protein